MHKIVFVVNGDEKTQKKMEFKKHKKLQKIVAEYG